MTNKTAIGNAVLALTALTVLSSANPCLGTVINFDDLAGPVALTNQYAPQGIMFSQIEATSQFATSVVAVSSPNYATPFYSNANTGMLWFVDPSNSSVPDYVNSVTITLNGFNSVGGWFDGATIEALDLSNSLIAGLTQTINPSNGFSYPSMSITFTGQIHELDFVNIPNTNGLGIFPLDDVTFGAITSTPEPATWFMVAAALVALGLRKRTA